MLGEEHCWSNNIDDLQDLLRFNEVESLAVEGDVLSSVTEEESSDTGERLGVRWGDHCDH